MGITEPAIFGVNLRYKFPFVIAMISSGIAGMFISVKGVLASSVGVGGVPGIFSIMSRYWGPFAIGMLIVLILPFAGTYGYARLKRQNRKPAGRLLSGCPFSLSIQNITGGEEK